MTTQEQILSAEIQDNKIVLKLGAQPSVEMHVQNNANIADAELKIFVEKLALSFNACLGININTLSTMEQGMFKNHIDEWSALQESQRSLLGALKLTINGTREGSALRRMCHEIIKEAEAI